jgi:hypothetical protein
MTSLPEDGERRPLRDGEKEVDNFDAAAEAQARLAVAACPVAAPAPAKGSVQNKYTGLLTADPQ